MLMGVRLESVLDDDLGILDVRQVEGPQEPYIGTTSTMYKSETRIPFKVQLSHGEVVIDLPGFKDTQGVILEIINQFCLIKVLTLCDEVKVIFVAGEDTIGEKLKLSIENFVDMFGDLSFMRGKNCLGLCITKVESHKQTKHIVNQIDKFKKEFSGLTDLTKEFLEIAKV
jgi:hypothetical protein